MGAGLIVSSLRSELREHLGDQMQSLSTPVLDDLILRSYWELQNNYKWRATEGQSGDVTLPAGSEYLDYTVPYTAITGIFLYDTNVEKWNKLEWKSRDEFQIARDGAEQMPKYYWQTGDPEGYVTDPATQGTLVTRVYFNPIADQDYTINIFFERQLTDLNDSYTMSPFPREAHEMILYGAVYRGFLRLRDFNSYERMKAAQENLLAKYVPEEAKVEKDRRTAKVVLSVRAYP